jgi:hypothetical protein
LMMMRRIVDESSTIRKRMPVGPNVVRSAAYGRSRPFTVPAV